MTRHGEIGRLHGEKATEHPGRPEERHPGNADIASCGEMISEQPVYRQISLSTENRGGSQTSNSTGKSGKHAAPAQTITVRRATRDDLTAIEAIERGCFASDGDAFSRRQLAYLVEKAQGGCLVACNSQQIIGYTALLTRRTARNVRIYSIAVDVSARGAGVGHTLISAAIDFARSKGFHAVTLEVRTDNRAALALYLRAGFTVGRLLHNYYHDGADGRRMEYRIK